MSIARHVTTRHRPPIAVTRRGAFDSSGIERRAVLSTNLLINSLWIKALETTEKRAKLKLKWDQEQLYYNINAIKNFMPEILKIGLMSIKVYSFFLIIPIIKYKVSANVKS